MDRDIPAGPVWALAVGQTLGYAAFFYIFAALIADWEAALGWGKPAFALGPMLAIGISAVLAPVAGQAVDRGFGPELLVGGAVLGGLSLLGLSQVRVPGEYLLAWAGLGVAQASCLYEVCFAFLIRRYGTAARPAIIRVTLVAGLASTLAFPSGAALALALGWRGAVLVAAGVVLGVMVPLHLWAGRAIRRSAPPPIPGGAAHDRAAPRHALRRPAFWGLAAVFSLVGLNHWMLMSFLVPLLTMQGAAPAIAVAAAATVGPGQVVGRLVLMRWEARIGTARATVVTMGGIMLASLFLFVAGLSPVLVFGFALIQGASLGVMTILRPMLVAEALGQAGYGAISGMLSIPTLAASAVAPVLGALLLEGGGPRVMIAVCFALASAAMVVAVALRR